jgi:hypothetical protein
VPTNAAEWRDVLVRRLDARWAEWKTYDAYYKGDQALAYATEKFREAYGGLFRDLRDNYMSLVVDSAAERLRVQGFRFGDQDADKDAWRIWQANGLDAQSNMVHTESIKLGEAYWVVQPNGDIPRITAEHPSQVIVATDPGDRRTRLAALKKWQGEDGYAYANVYLPDRVVKYRQVRRPSVIDGISDYGTAKWETIGASGNPLGVVPIIPVPNNPSMLEGGRSDLAGGALSIQDGINKELADMIVGSEYTAFRQRVILGIDQPKDEQGRPIPIDRKDTERQSRESRLWMFPGKDGKAFEFSATDLSNFRQAIDGLTGDLAAQTRIPIYYFRPQAISNISAEALIGLDAGLVSKTDDKKEPMGEGHEEMTRLAFRSVDPKDERANATDAETIWRNTESRSQAQVVDAAVKKQTLGVPWEQIMEDIGYSPQQIDRMAAMREEERLTAESLGPGAAPTVPPSSVATPGQTQGGPAVQETP